MKILYLIHITGFDALTENDNKKANASVEGMICTTLYLENLYKARFYDLDNRIKNDYDLNKAECLRNVTVVHGIILNCQPKHNSNGKPLSKGFSN